jgi:PHP family Zn ribbon phosphoesterase
MSALMKSTCDECGKEFTFEKDEMESHNFCPDCAEGMDEGELDGSRELYQHLVDSDHS